MKQSSGCSSNERSLLAVVAVMLVAVAAAPVVHAAERAPADDRSDAAVEDPDKEINDSNLPPQAKAERKLMLRPNDRKARIEAARAYLAEGADKSANVDAAHEHVLAVLAEQPNDVESLLLAGRISLLRSDAAEAVRHYRAATSVAPENASAFLGLGNALTRVGDETGAAAAFEQYRALKGMAPIPRAENK